MATASFDGDEPSLTPFQTRVYDVVRTIPKGFVRSYGSIAQELQTSARAVGTAMGRNPFGPSDHVPWHRVVASDRSIGGFGHSWGEDQPKVQKKRRLLEEEGVVFEEEGKSNKIREDFFVEGTSVSKSIIKRKSATRSKGSKKQKIVEEPPSNQTATEKRKSKYFDTAFEEKLKQEIINLLQKRQVGKTCWPSEIPRGMAKRGDISVDWRSLMSATRDAARSLVREGKVDVIQKGTILGIEEEYRGPIRLRLSLD